MGGVYGLDFGAILAFAQARGADPELIADLLPRIEPLIVARHGKDVDDADS
jgi:hypothetical protein